MSSTRDPKTVTCRYCGAEFFSKVKRGPVADFCSNSCRQAEYRIVNLKCDVCLDFVRQKSDLKTNEHGIKMCAECAEMTSLHDDLISKKMKMTNFLIGEWHKYQDLIDDIAEGGALALANTSEPPVHRHYLLNTTRMDLEGLLRDQAKVRRRAIMIEMTLPEGVKIKLDNVLML